MRSDLLERVIRLVSRTGERHVLVDPALPEPIVLLPLGAYEALALGKTTQPTRESAFPAPEPRFSVEDTPPPQASDDSPLKLANFSGESAPDEDRFYLEPID